ncbi:MAG: 50S ribosomal protein L22 [Desulfurococcales archaeon]|nr:50S ribosomal protein L22 [Desulfurococcales archaeon]
MPKWRYSVKKLDPQRTAKAMLRDVNISLKESYEVLKIIRGMKLKEAEKFLEDVIKMKIPVPYVRYKLSIAHKRGLADRFPRWKSPVGRYPVKTARFILKLLKNVENNAEVKDLDVERLVIIHAAAHKGPYLKRWTPRAFGRSTPKFRTLTHLEVVVKEV